MERHQGIRAVNQNLTKVIRISRAAEKSFLNQSLLQLERVVLLRVADVVQKYAAREQKQDDTNDV